LNVKVVIALQKVGAINHELTGDNLEIWRFGDLEMGDLEFGDLEIWRFGC
jgi:hypothetical protein